MIKEIKITVHHEHLDWNHSAPEGGTTPMAHHISVDIETTGGDEPVSQTETLKVLTTAMTMVLNAKGLPPTKRQSTPRKR